MNEKEILYEEIELLSGYRSLYQFVDIMSQKSSRDSIRFYVQTHKIRRVIIYGAGVLGRIVADAFRDIEECSVIGVIDKGRNTAYGFEKFFLISDLQDVDYDLIVISPLGALGAIEDDLRKNEIEKFCFALELVDERGRKELYENGLFI